MKVNYFTTANIEHKALQMLGKLAEFRARHPLRFQPKEACLLVIDMQRYFLGENSHAFLPSAPVIVPRIKALAKAFQAKDRPVIYTRHINDQSNARMLAKWWDDIIIEDNPLNEIIPELYCEKATMVKKTQYDAFHLTPLAEILDQKGIKQLVITGVMTHLCCETTARTAFVRGYEVLFGIDCTATENEDFHMNTLSNLAHGFAVPFLSLELLKCLV
jgi:isochorismate hydrolase